jgi:hypothetical protein
MGVTKRIILAVSEKAIATSAFLHWSSFAASKGLKFSVLLLLRPIRKFRKQSGLVFESVLLLYMLGQTPRIYKGFKHILLI